MGFLVAKVGLYTHEVWWRPVGSNCVWVGEWKEEGGGGVDKEVARGNGVGWRGCIRVHRLTAAAASAAADCVSCRAGAMTPLWLSMAAQQRTSRRPAAPQVLIQNLRPPTGAKSTQQEAIRDSVCDVIGSQSKLRAGVLSTVEYSVLGSPPPPPPLSNGVDHHLCCCQPPAGCCAVLCYAGDLLPLVLQHIGGPFLQLVSSRDQSEGVRAKLRGLYAQLVAGCVVAGGCEGWVRGMGAGTSLVVWAGDACMMIESLTAGREGAEPFHAPASSREGRLPHPSSREGRLPHPSSREGRLPHPSSREGWLPPFISLLPPLTCSLRRDM